MPVQQMTVDARDGFTLSASLFQPDDTSLSPLGLVVINSATAVRQGFYARFARFLAEEGFVVLTYDYRGIGMSRPRSLRGFVADVRQWGELDIDGIISWGIARFPNVPLSVIGHSIGGVLLALAPQAVHAQRCVLVTPQNGYWRLFPTPQREGWALIWYCLVPALTKLFGYFPARVLGFGEDLPAGVADEFARWCTRPDYLIDDNSGISRSVFHKLRSPILAISVDDDPAAPEPGVESILRLFDGAPVVRRHLIPSQLGLDSLGHFGFFRETHRETLWKEVLTWCSLGSEHVSN